MMSANDRGDATGPRRIRPPSGTAYPAVGGGDPPDPPDEFNDLSNPGSTTPIPVVLARWTFIKFGVIMFGSLILTFSSVLAIYWSHYYKVEYHITNGNAHLSVGERDKLETKVQAQQARTKMLKAIKTHTNVKIREVVVEQREEFQKWSGEQEKDHKRQFEKVLKEIKKTRQAVSR